MRLVVLMMMVLACTLAASANRVRRGSRFEKGDRKMPPSTPGPDLEGEDTNRPRVRRANPFEKGNRPMPPPTEGPDLEGEDTNRPRVRRAKPKFDDRLRRMAKRQARR